MVKDAAVHPTDKGDAQATAPPRDKLDITFEDSKAAFKSKTTWELIRAYIVYMICSSNYIVENNLKVNVTVHNRNNAATYLIHNLLHPLPPKPLRSGRTYPKIDDVRFIFSSRAAPRGY